MELTYEQAMQRLEQIATQMERGETTIDQMAKQLKEAQALLQQCRKQLTGAEQQCEHLLNESEASAVE